LKFSIHSLQISTFTGLINNWSSPKIDSESQYHFTVLLLFYRFNDASFWKEMCQTHGLELWMDRCFKSDVQLRWFFQFQSKETAFGNVDFDWNISLSNVNWNVHLNIRREHLTVIAYRESKTKYFNQIFAFIQTILHNK
jgi:hypothetical protein